VLTRVITGIIYEKVPKIKLASHQKWWWSKELTQKRREVCRVAHSAYNRRLESEDLVHWEHKNVRRAYVAMIEAAKMAHWEGFLESVDEKTVWMAHRYTPQMEGGPAYQPSRWTRMQE